MGDTMYRHEGMIRKLAAFIYGGIAFGIIQIIDGTLGREL